MAKARTDSKTAGKAQALREAADLGCTGAHRHPDGTWMACSTMEEYERLTAGQGEKSGLELIEETQRIRSQKGNKRKRRNKRQWEKLRERGIAGIDTLSGGGLVSGAHGKGLTFRPVDGDEDVFDNINDARRRARRIGCIGVSRRTSRSGRRVWVPCTNMTDYARATGSTALGRRYQDRMARQRVRRIVQEELARAYRDSRRRRKKRLFEELYDVKALGRSIGRIGRSLTVFDPDAWDGDHDGIVQEGTPWERPSIPGINTNLPGTRGTRRKPKDFPPDTQRPEWADGDAWAAPANRERWPHSRAGDAMVTRLEGPWKGTYIPDPDDMQSRGGVRSARSFGGEQVPEVLDEGVRFRIDALDEAGGMRSRRIDPKNSSAVNEINYDADTEELTVDFAGGKGSYVFGGITSEMADDIDSSSSIGRAVNDMQESFWARLHEDGTGYIVKPDGTRIEGTPIVHPRAGETVAIGELVADPNFPHPALEQIGHAEHTQMVPIEFFDNMPGNIQGKTDRDDRLVAAPAGVLRDFEINAPIILQMTDDLTDDVRSNGIKNALMVNYNPETGDVNLEEGNHRLIAARRLGMTHVPVRMNRTAENRERIRGPRKQIGGMRKNERYEHLDLGGEYLGSAFKPSQVGAPTRPKGGGTQGMRSTRSGGKADSSAIVDTAMERLGDIFGEGEFGSDDILRNIAEDLVFRSYGEDVELSEEKLQSIRELFEERDPEFMDMLQEPKRVRETTRGYKRLTESNLDSGVGIHTVSKDGSSETSINLFDKIATDKPITLYHGGRVDLTGDIEYEVGGNDSGQWGPGTYTTASAFPAVKGWANPWKRTEDGGYETGPPGYLHTTRWKGDSPPRILDMEEPLPPDVLELAEDLHEGVLGAMERAKTTYVGGKLELNEDQQLHADTVIEEIEYRLGRIRKGHDTTGREILLQLQASLQDADPRRWENDDIGFLTTDVIDEIRAEIQQRIGALGYDVIKSAEKGIREMSRVDYMFLDKDMIEFVDAAPMTTLFGFGNGYNGALPRLVGQRTNKRKSGMRSRVDRPRPSPFDKEIVRLEQAAETMRAATGRGPLPPRITQADKQRMAERDPKQNLRDLDATIDEYVAFLEEHHRHDFSGNADAISAIDDAHPGLVNRHDRHKDRLNEIASFFEEERASLEEARFEQGAVQDELSSLTRRFDRANAGNSQRRRMSEAMSQGRQRDEFLAAEVGDLAVDRDALDPTGPAATWRVVEEERKEILELERKLKVLQQETEAHPNGAELVLKQFRERVQAKLSKHQGPDKVLEIGKGNEALNPGQGMRSRRDALSDHNKEWLKTVLTNPGYWDEAPAVVRNVVSNQVRQEAMSLRGTGIHRASGMRSGGRKVGEQVIGKVKPEHRNKPEGGRTLFFVGGTTGSGKSTMIRNKKIDLPDDTEAAHIDPDHIKAGLDGWDPQRAGDFHYESRRVTDRIMNDAMNAGMDMVVQGTGKRDEHLTEARRRGYKTAGHFIYVDPGEAERRIAQRKAEGGPNIPNHFGRQIAGELQGHIPRQITDGLYDDFFLWDSSGPTPRLIAYRTEDGHFAIHGREEFNAFFGHGAKRVEQYWQKNR